MWHIGIYTSSGGIDVVYSPLCSRRPGTALAERRRKQGALVPQPAPQPLLKAIQEILECVTRLW